MAASTAEGEENAHDVERADALLVLLGQAEWQGDVEVVVPPVREACGHGRHGAAPAVEGQYEHLGGYNSSEPIFESAVICNYLEDTTLPLLHPANTLQRARHRARMEFGSAVLNTIAGVYSSPGDTALNGKAAELRSRFQPIDAALGVTGMFIGCKRSAQGLAPS